MKKSELRAIIKEELLNENVEVGALYNGKNIRLTFGKNSDGEIWLKTSNSTALYYIDQSEWKKILRIK